MTSDNVIKGMEQLQKLGLNWDVQKIPLVTNSSDINFSDISTTKCAIVREDKKKVIGVVGEDYQPFQNSELYDLIQTLSHATDRKIANGGFFSNGSKVYMQIKTSNLSIGADIVEGYITVINSFDGSTALSFGNTNRTISCSNTFHGVYKQLSTRIRHNVSMKLRVDEVMADYERFIENEKEMFKTIKRLSEQTLNREVVEGIEKAFFNIKDYDNMSTRKENLLKDFRLAMSNEVGEKGENVWGAFSGLTKYTTHIDRSSDESKMIGNVAMRTRRVFSDLTELVK